MECILEATQRFTMTTLITTTHKYWKDIMAFYIIKIKE